MRNLSKTSALYGLFLWKAGVFAAATLPRGFSQSIALFLAGCYAAARPGRRQVVAENLLPIFAGNSRAARKASQLVFKEFGRKLVDLWRFESGQPVTNLFHQWTGWDHFEAVRRDGRGILLLTAHLGNWEFGAPLLIERGIKLQVVTLPEPGTLTGHRQERRQRWGIETLVIGEDPFNFLKIIQALEAGSTVAILIDRPWGATTTVELFGRPFAASLGAAELARATRCALLPVYLPRVGHGYAAHLLPPIDYDSASLREPPAKHALTQKIIRAFEEPIRHYPTQWYQFVPVWRQFG